MGILHIGYAKGVINECDHIFTVANMSFTDVLRKTYNNSFNQSEKDFMKTQYSLFLILHDPDPVNFGGLRFDLIDSLSDANNTKNISLDYSKFISGCNKIIENAPGYYTLERNGNKLSPGDPRVALHDVLITLQNVGITIPNKHLEILKIGSTPSEAEYTQMIDGLIKEMKSLYIDFFVESFRSDLEDGLIIHF